jgi:hypothetical protein
MKYRRRIYYSAEQRAEIRDPGSMATWGVDEVDWVCL